MSEATFCILIVRLTQVWSQITKTAPLWIFTPNIPNMNKVAALGKEIAEKVVSVDFIS